MAKVAAPVVVSIHAPVKGATDLSRSGSASVEYPTNVAAMGNTTSFPPIVERLCDVRDVDGEAWHSQPFPAWNLNAMPILRADNDDV